MLSAASCCSSQFSESSKAVRRKHADILPSPILIPSPCQEECNKIDVGLRELPRKFFVVSWGDASSDCEGKKKKTTKHSCSISRNKNLLIKGAFMTVCKVSWAKQGCIHQHSGHKVLGFAFAVECCVHEWMDVAMGALVRHQAALVSAKAEFYQSAQII